jgi:DNA-binding CsgD family transcriptional regulator
MQPSAEVLASVLPLVRAAPDPQAAIEAVAELVASLGYTAVDVVLANRALRRWNEPAVESALYKSGFPVSWDRIWPRYILVDPILPATSSAIWGVEIAGLRRAEGQSAMLTEFWTYLVDSGLSEGVSVPVHLPGGAFAAVALYRDGGRGPTDSDAFVLGQYFGRAFAERFLSSRSPDNPLSEREIECLYWASVGKTTDDIALILGRAPQTVRFHIENASRKLGVVNRISAIAQACARGLISPNGTESLADRPVAEDRPRA